MEGLDYWRLCDELSVIQAALLIVGVDPATCQEYISGWAASTRPAGYDASFAVLTHAIVASRLKARIRRIAREHAQEEYPEHDDFGTDEQGNRVVFKINPDWTITTVEVDNLRDWLRGRGIKTGFFFPEETNSVDYLNSSDPQYAPKLAAAIRAWESVKGDPSAMRGKTVKQAIVTWLRRHADRYGLTKEDGNPNEQGIEEVAKIANWDTKGGAPKTPGE